MTYQQILAVIVPVLLAAVPFARAYVKTYLTPERVAHVADIARQAVRGAEQIATAFKGADPMRWAGFETWGEAKFDYAAGVVASGAKRLGIKLTEDEVASYVHTYLREMEAPVAA